MIDIAIRERVQRDLHNWVYQQVGKYGPNIIYDDRWRARYTEKRAQLTLKAMEALCGTL